MWINTITEEVYRSHSEIRSAFPQTSFPSVLTDDLISGFDVLPVVKTEMPNPGPTKNVAEGAPAFADGAWRQTWSISDATEEQIAEKADAEATAAREKRKKLLAETDWMALSDNTLTTEWATYRQALRDITSHANFPFLADGDWPQIPG